MPPAPPIHADLEDIMAENETAPNANGADTAPQIGLIAQYVKDLSFENPNAPAVYQWQTQPQIDVSFNIGTQQAAEDVHEVSMKIEVRAADGQGQTAFAVELVYAGLFGIRNVPADQMQGFLYAEAPRLMFPFARRIVAETVRDGNFPPLMLDPIDFGAMYLAQAQQAETLAGSEPAGQA
jgi:preprotein translocase subunit SecB